MLILESTYGDRLHEEAGEEMKQKAQELIAHAKTHKSKIIVPAFALGRTQELVMRIKELVGEGRVDPIPIYIDSPLARRPPRSSAASGMLRRRDSERLPRGRSLRLTLYPLCSSPEDSKRLNGLKGPCVIISSSGMCEGGRVVHHLKHAIQDEANVIVFVGFQAEHTLGRKLVEGWDVVPIFGVPTKRRAQIVKFNGLSAHADRHDLLAYVRAINPAPGKVFIVHGEENRPCHWPRPSRRNIPK